MSNRLLYIDISKNNPKVWAMLALVPTAFFLLVGCKNAKSSSQEIDYTQYVNPFIGNSATGHTSPGASYPLGIMQPGPQTGNYSWEYCAGYVYGDSKIQGFSQNRLNGTGCIDLGDLLVQPFSGTKTFPFYSDYDLNSQKASPGYYAVNLTENAVNVEITASPHVSFHKYSFTGEGDAHVLIDFQSGLVWSKDKIHSHVLENEVVFENETTISGYTRRKEWAERLYYFVIQFDRPILTKEKLPARDPREKASRYLLSFGTKTPRTLHMKIGMSSSSVEGAKKNMITEVFSWNFELTKKSASQAWNKYLSKIKIDATDSQKVNFYTAMYHLFIQPNNIADIDGKYIGPNGQVSKASGARLFSTLSQWDTFRAAYPLYTVISPEIVPDMVNSMLDISEQKGHLPIWGLWGQETYTMIGNHSVPMIVDAYLKGFKGFDANKAYGEIKKTLTTSTHPKSDWKVYDQYGYYPFDIVKLESASRTMECGFDDYSAALMAEKMGNQADYEFFSKRSNYYKSIFDKNYKVVRPKDSKGNWRKLFSPYAIAHADSELGGDYTEGNASQYTWHVLQDLPGLIDLMGGKASASKSLDSLFFTTQKSEISIPDVTGLIGQYAHGNEPSHHVAYIYTYLDQPWKTQGLVHQICKDFYKNAPDGLIGNDDCGQMSSWYIFSSMGFYPVNPVGGEFVIGAPQISSATIEVGKGKTFSVATKNFSQDHHYVERLELNGKPYDKKTISYKDIMNGGTLTFYMTSTPNTHK